MKFVVAKGSLDALMALSDGDIWQAHQMKIDTDIDIDFDLNGGGRNAENSAGVGFDEHNESGFDSKFYIL
jgi:hypothetical protein